MKRIYQALISFIFTVVICFGNSVFFKQQPQPKHAGWNIGALKEITKIDISSQNGFIKNSACKQEKGNTFGGFIYCPKSVQKSFISYLNLNNNIYSNINLADAAQIKHNVSPRAP